VSCALEIDLATAAASYHASYSPTYHVLRLAPACMVLRRATVGFLLGHALTRQGEDPETSEWLSRVSFLQASCDTHYSTRRSSSERSTVPVR
jgi:hypothetical protein